MKAMAMPTDMARKKSTVDGVFPTNDSDDVEVSESDVASETIVEEGSAVDISVVWWICSELNGRDMTLND